MSGGAPKADVDTISDAIDAMNKAAEALAKTAGATAGHETQRSPESPQPAADTEETQRFYRHLEQRGQLVDVEDTADLSKLPPHITHVRFPDGRVERLGFS